jgi:hypothetical protein
MITAIAGAVRAALPLLSRGAGAAGAAEGGAAASTSSRLAQGYQVASNFKGNQNNSNAQQSSSNTASNFQTDARLSEIGR